MDIDQLRQKFLDFFTKQGYQPHPAASVVPDNDPSVLLTTAGMQQFKLYYTYPDQAPAKKVVTVQPVIRTTDIAEVGDETHLTSFEMLGNFCFDETDPRQMKERAIKDAYNFLIKELKIEKSEIHATVFIPNDKNDERIGLSADKDSEEIWRSLGIRVETSDPTFFPFDNENFWGPTGNEGPCGRTTEIFIKNIEVWNLVFNEFYAKFDRENGNPRNYTYQLEPLKAPGLDTGSGLERLAAILQGKKSIWEIAPFKDWLENIDSANQNESRIIADHLRAIVFLISNGIVPGNKGREYVLRRLIRKVVFLAKKIDFHSDWQTIIEPIARYYSPHYPISAPAAITEEFIKERDRFNHNLVQAVNHLEKWLGSHPNAATQDITELAFYLYESFGFPKELVIEHLADLGYAIDSQHFQQLFTQHQEVSRAGIAGQFKGGLADHQEQTIKHHTAHHLLLAALRQVLGTTVVQRGSNVTSERLRLDFNFDRKLTAEELKEVETIVNEKIKEDMPVIHQELPKEEALQSGALAEFGQKYGDLVSVYVIGDFSKELCGGPHVAHTGQLGHFTILKEEASSQGVRRIKAKVN
jgi:alanyl-tRNA synthetase